MLGRYEVLKHLAQGGMADVLIARATGIEGFERHVVIKRIRTEQASDQQYVRMFLDEARLAASLHHHNVAQVHDIGESNGAYFFAMEYVHGQDVRKLLSQVAERDQRIPLEHVITIVAGAAAGLHHAHEQRGPDRNPLGIVHRDVSPANILVGYDGAVKVTDFGIAKAAHQTSETQTGNLKGKAAYMSPEQCNGLAVDRRSDVFGLGIVLYELVTVRRLFKGENDFVTMTSIVKGDIPPPSMVWAALPPQLEKIILKALSLVPSDRYATADEMRLALEQFATSAGLRTSSTALADYMKQQFTSRLEPWLADDDDEAEIEIGNDFDGSSPGVARAPSGSFQGFGLPAAGKSAPILKARTRAITAQRLPPTEAPASSTPPRGDFEPTVHAPTTMSGTPASLSFRTPQPSQRVRRRRWVIGGAAVASAIFAIVLAVAVSPSGDQAQPSRVPALGLTTVRVAAPPATAAAAPTAPAVPLPTPVAHETAAPTDPPTDAAPAAPTPRGPRKHPVRRAKLTPKPADKRWDPNALFPK